MQHRPIFKTPGSRWSMVHVDFPKMPVQRLYFFVRDAVKMQPAVVRAASGLGSYQSCRRARISNEGTALERSRCRLEETPYSHATGRPRVCRPDKVCGGTLLENLSEAASGYGGCQLMIGSVPVKTHYHHIHHNFLRARSSSS